MFNSGKPASREQSNNQAAKNSLASKFSGLGSVKNAPLGGDIFGSKKNALQQDQHRDDEEETKQSVSSKFNFAAYLQSNDQPSHVTMGAQANNNQLFSQ